VMMSIETMYEMDKKQAKILEYVDNLKEKYELQVVSIQDNLDMHLYIDLLIK